MISHTQTSLDLEEDSLDSFRNIPMKKVIHNKKWVNSKQTKAFSTNNVVHIISS